MRHVLYHVDDRVILQIEYLRGALLPTRDEPPWFDDPESFSLAIDTGVVTISATSLSALLNDYVFNYDGSPLENLTVSVDKGQLKQKGTLHQGIPLPFTIRAELSTTPDGRLRLHPTSVEVAGIGVKGLMRTFGIELENLVKVQRGRGVEISDNDFLLSPAGLLPPPRIEGRVTSVRLGDAFIDQTFGGSKRPGRAQPLHPSDPSARNYMFLPGKGAALRQVDHDGRRSADRGLRSRRSLRFRPGPPQRAAGRRGEPQPAGFRPRHGHARLRGYPAGRRGFRRKA
jgi:hypothetical protein